MKSRGLILAGIVTALLGAGCQPPGQIPTQPARVVVHYGNMELASSADLAIVLDVRNLLGTGYRVQQAAGEAAVRTISAKVTGPNIVEPIVTSINLIDCKNGLATLNFSQLPPGPVDIAVNAVGDSGQVLSWATGKAVIAPNKTAVVTLRCSTATGGLTINFDCPDLCDGTTPSPSPTPTPSPVTVPATLMNGINTIAADEQGNLYLSGSDLPPLDPSKSGTWGKVLKVTPNLTLETTPVYDNLSTLHDMEVINGRLYGYQTYAFEILKLNLATLPAVAEPYKFKNGLTTYQFWAMTKTAQNKLVVSLDGLGWGFAFKRENDDPTKLPITLFASSTYPSPMPNSSVNRVAYDNVNQLPLWTGTTGIFTVDPATTKIKTVLDLSNQGIGQGLTATDPATTEFLFTKGNDRSVYLMDVANPTAFAPAYTFTDMYPRDVEKGADGYYYVLAYSTPTFGSGYWVSGTKFTVTKFELKNGTLNPLLLMVNNR